MYNTLPRSPSRLITMALKDLRASVKAGVQVNMHEWVYRTNSKTRCTVCFAGAIMKQRMDLGNWDIASPNGLFDDGLISHDDRSRLHALNKFRIGHVSEGLVCLGLYFHLPAEMKGLDVPSYEDDSEGFFKAMEKMASMFREHGL